MTDSTLTPPAGWYPDPDDAGRERYWDGSTWAAGTEAGIPADLDVEKPKTLGKAYLWWFPLGIFGAHHFYMGRKVWGWITALTLNLLLLGWVLDGIFMYYWVSHIEKDRESVRQMRAGAKQAAVGLGEAGRVIISGTGQAAKFLGPIAVEATSQVSQSMRLGGFALSRDKTELIFQGRYIPPSVAQVSVVSGTATSRVSGTNVVGGALVGGALGSAGVGAVVGATARKNTSKIYIVVDYPGGQWVGETSHTNERSARRFAAKVNSL